MRYGQGGESLSSDSIEALEEICKSNLLTELAEQYISGCYGECADSSRPSSASKSGTRSGTSSDGVSGARAASKSARGAKFPNLAGFCRHLGIGTADFELLCDKYPSECGTVLAALEDEALNSGNSATLISAYMKHRLGYGKQLGEQKFQCDSEKYELVFEHDIFEDGA